MAPLKNARHERFAQALFWGKSAHQAYIDAGYKPCRQNAARLTTNDDVRGRLTELQEAVAEANEVTVSSLLDELEAARRQAASLDQLSAADRAIEAKAKVSGLLVQRMEIGSANEFSGCDTAPATVDRLIELTVAETPDAHFAAEDRNKLLAMLTALGEFINSCKARPINGPEYSQRAVELQHRPRLNGRHRH